MTININNQSLASSNALASLAAKRGMALGGKNDASPASPAYVLDISAISTGMSEEEFREKVLSSREKLSQSLPSDAIKLPPDESKTLPAVSGDTTAAFELGTLYDFAKHEPSMLDSEYQDIYGKIEAGGKEVLLDYNLRFAGISAAHSETINDKIASELAADGKCKIEEYAKIKDFAAELGKKANVYVVPNFGYTASIGGVTAENSGEFENVSYNYLGAVCNVGVSTLGVMANYREADDIWQKLVQGGYKNRDEMIAELRDNDMGYVADAYIDAARQAYQKRGNDFDEKEWAVRDFYKGNGGAMWDVALRAKQTSGFDNAPSVFQTLCGKYLGEEKPHYTATQMEEAYREGNNRFNAIVNNRKEIAKESARKIAGESLDQDDSENNLQARIKELRKKIRDISDQIKEIERTSLPDEKKAEMIRQFEQQMKNYQTQINDLLDRMAKNPQM